MWGLWFFPLIIALFIVGSVAGVVWYFGSRRERRPKIAAVVAIPIGCVGIPVVGLVLLAALGSFLQKGDAELYEEIFGYQAAITGDRMLFDDFGGGADREIFMRAEPTEAERKKLLSIPGLAESEYTLNQFVARGAQHSFTWWISTNPEDQNYCQSVRVRDAHGFRGWQEFRIAECLKGRPDWPSDARNIFVVAAGRR